MTSLTLTAGGAKSPNYIKDYLSEGSCLTRNKDLDALSLCHMPHGHTTVRMKSRQWTNEQMEAAMKSFLDGRLSAIKAADLHGVTRTMLKDRLSGRVVHGTNPGLKPYLTADEEGKLCRHLCVSNMGLRKTQHDVTCLVEMHVKNKGLLRATQFPMVGGKNNGHDGKCTQYVNTKTHAHLHTHSHKNRHSHILCTLSCHNY